MTKLGMDPDQVRALSGQIDGQLGVLDSAQGAVALAATVSSSPLEFMLNPGALILSPWSITQTTIANAEIALARASAQELVAKLLAEAGAQEWASSDIDALYFEPVAWRTPDASKVPQVNPLDLLGPFAWIKNLAGTVSDVWGAAEEVIAGIKRWATPTFNAMKDWYDDFPPWAKGLSKLGKILPWVGITVSLADLGVAWAEGDTAGIVQGVVSVIADGVSFVPGPVGWVAAAVGIVWDVGWTVAENIEVVVNDPLVMGEYYMEYPWMAPIHAVIPLTVEIWGPLAG